MIELYHGQRNGVFLVVLSLTTPLVDKPALHVEDGHWINLKLNSLTLIWTTVNEENEVLTI